ncbi:hypothetical protein HHX47_DHR6000776 [Lentinula edodes]|nr:hypothetical protein HHX47_DHR6000776 [Lentinula edodes]
MVVSCLSRLSPLSPCHPGAQPSIPFLIFFGCFVVPRDLTKYAFASQEGVICIWDVRSTKPLRVYQTDKSESWNGSGNGLASGYLSDHPYEWTKAPGWSARSIEFGNGGVDGTFETEEIIQAPSIPALKQGKSPSTTAGTSSVRLTITPRTSQTRRKAIGPMFFHVNVRNLAPELLPLRLSIHTGMFQALNR